MHSPDRRDWGGIGKTCSDSSPSGNGSLATAAGPLPRGLEELERTGIQARCSATRRRGTLSSSLLSANRQPNGRVELIVLSCDQARVGQRMEVHLIGASGLDFATITVEALEGGGTEASLADLRLELAFLIGEPLPSFPQVAATHVFEDNLSNSPTAWARTSVWVVGPAEVQPGCLPLPAKGVHGSARSSATILSWRSRTPSARTAGRRNTRTHW